MAQLQLKHIHKSFGKEKVLHNINLLAEAGEFVVLVGPSGCGKSTILRIIAGLETADSGDVFINRQDMRSIPPQHRNVAMVFQNYALYPHKNVRDNLTFGLQKDRLSKKEIQERLSQAASTLQLENMLDKKPAQLSGGQQQRVAMGRAIVRDATLFLYDEPLSNLDAALRRQMRREIKQIHKTYQRTSIYVTHDQVEAMTLGDKITVIRNGTVEQTGTPMDVYLNPANLFVAGFIGAPPMNMMDARLYKDHVEIDEQKISFSGSHDLRRLAIPNTGKMVKMGIRPDFLYHEEQVQKNMTWGSLENARVRMVEPLGYDQEIELLLEKQCINAMLASGTTVREGDRINLVFDWEHVIFFDPETGKNLFYKRAG